MADQVVDVATALLVVEGAAAQLREAYEDRAVAMRTAQQAGATLQQIGRAAGLSPEGVRYVLVKARADRLVAGMD